MSTKRHHPKYRSKYEKRIGEDLRKRKRRAEYEPQSPEIRYVLPKRYIPDWKLPNGVFVEAKGYFPAKDRSKLLRVRKENPDLDLRILFQSANNRLTKSPNSMMYWQWAEKHGFPWAEGDSIPEEWFND